MSHGRTKHVNLLFFTRWASEQVQQIGNSIATYLSSLKMEGITIVSHNFTAAEAGKTRLIVMIKVCGVNAAHKISEFAKKVILDLRAVPMYSEKHAHA